MRIGELEHYLMHDEDDKKFQNGLKLLISIDTFAWYNDVTRRLVYNEKRK